MTPEQQLEKLLHELSELQRYEFGRTTTLTPIVKSESGKYVYWQDIEAILKQTFPDDEFH